MRKRANFDSLLLIFILLVGVVLRLHNFNHLMFTFDEFSAYFRTGFDNFHDLIINGVVKPDTHPPGVQVFLNYWIKIFGNNQVIIRLPFVLMGLASIWIAYLIGKDWFNPTVGLITALFLSVLQYPIIYTIFARPYASGLFFILMTVWFWNRAFIVEKGKFWLNAAGYVLFGVLSAYDHYFALFLLALVGVSGLITIRKKLIKSYLLTNFLIILLFLPYIRYFFIQLNKGGVGSWLAKPTPDFFVKYIEYILHFSPVMYFLVAAMIIFSFFYGSKNLKHGNRYRLLMIVWIAITWLTGYFYSVKVNAVLQYSVLIFTFPFLVMLVFSWIRDLKPKVKMTLSGVFMTAAILTLVINRQQYKILYHSGYEEILQEVKSFNQRFTSDSLTALVELPEKIENYYCRELNVQPGIYQSLDSVWEVRKFRNYLDHQNSQYLLLAWNGDRRPELLPVSMEYYPFMIGEDNWLLCDLYLFTKFPPKGHYQQADKILFSDERKWHLAEKADTSMIHNSQSEIKGIRNREFTGEYFPLYKCGLDSILEGKNNLVVLRLKVGSLPDTTNALLVSEIKSGDELIDWRTASFAGFAEKNKDVNRIYLVIRMANVNLKRENNLLNVYIWNKAHEPLHVNDFRIEVWEGNPYLYGIFEKIGK